MYTNHLWCANKHNKIRPQQILLSNDINVEVYGEKTVCNGAISNIQYYLYTRQQHALHMAQGVSQQVSNILN